MNTVALMLAQRKISQRNEADKILADSRKHFFEHHYREDNSVSSFAWDEVNVDQVTQLAKSYLCKKLRALNMDALIDTEIDDFVQDVMLALATVKARSADAPLKGAISFCIKKLVAHLEEQRNESKALAQLAEVYEVGGVNRLHSGSITRYPMLKLGDALPCKRVVLYRADEDEVIC